MQKKIKQLEEQKRQLAKALSEIGHSPDNDSDRSFYKQCLEKLHEEIETLKTEVWE